jgi:hypothetical protein
MRLARRGEARAAHAAARRHRHSSARHTQAHEYGLQALCKRAQLPAAAAAILQAQSPARTKEFQVVPGASHNTVIASAGELYFSMIKQFCNKICGIRAQRRRKIN